VAFLLAGAAKPVAELRESRSDSPRGRADAIIGRQTGAGAEVERH